MPLNVLIVEDEESHYQVLAVVDSLTEAKELAAADLLSRQKRLLSDDDPGLCPYQYAMWERALEGYKEAASWSAFDLPQVTPEPEGSKSLLMQYVEKRYGLDFAITTRNYYDSILDVLHSVQDPEHVTQIVNSFSKGSIIRELLWRIGVDWRASALKTDEEYKAIFVKVLLSKLPRPTNA